MKGVRLHFVDSHRGISEFLNNFLLLYIRLHSVLYTLPRFISLSHAVDPLQHQYIVTALPCPLNERIAYRPTAIHVSDMVLAILQLRL
jgi:hypothetical protein